MVGFRPKCTAKHSASLRFLVPPRTWHWLRLWTTSPSARGWIQQCWSGRRGVQGDCVAADSHTGQHRPRMRGEKAQCGDPSHTIDPAAPNHGHVLRERPQLMTQGQTQTMNNCAPSNLRAVPDLGFERDPLGGRHEGHHAPAVANSLTSSSCSPSFFAAPPSPPLNPSSRRCFGRTRKSLDRDTDRPGAPPARHGRYKATVATKRTIAEDER